MAVFEQADILAVLWWQSTAPRDCADCNARDPAALAAAKFPEHEVVHRRASIEDAVSLDQASRGREPSSTARVPFLKRAMRWKRAALRSGIHYLDVSVKQPTTRAILDKYDVAAREAGVAPDSRDGSA